ncbi:hypothetical protein COCON_G00072210 [Conger conger]|uniref:Ephrin type-B receptor 4 n=1 Tax=Conger conger TaxID=82655 RepID=A0A9Q1DN33_CONCO|nr:hypothetical protein COCON_G00072210 [Conger conger]
MERVCAAIGIILLQCLCHLSAEEEILMYTKTETSDLKWTIHPRVNPQWEEVSGLDEDNNSVRTYQICPADGGRGQPLAAQHADRAAGAWQAYVELRFTMMECSSRPTSMRSCKRPRPHPPWNLLYYQTEAYLEATPAHPPWMENPYVKVDTVAADFLLRKGGERKFNVKTLRLGPLTARGFYLAFQAQGACMALLSVREALGACVSHAALRPPKPAAPAPAPPRMFCGEDGQWVGQPTSTCACLPGYQPVAMDTACKECPVGQFKPSPGAGPCSACPVNSLTTNPGAASCSCRPGYLRASSDTPEMPCTKPPSAPRSIVTQVNDTSVTLEWSEPLDSGGRRDLSYAVGGLTARRVTVWGLLPHTTYSFSVQALNGVSQPSGRAPAGESVNVTTSHDVPVLVSGIMQGRATESSLSLHWTRPEQPHYNILLYQLRYCEKQKQEGPSCRYKETLSNEAVLTDLRRATEYEVQVRARTVAGYGTFSSATRVRTLPEDTPDSQLMVTGVLVAMGTLLLISIIAMAVFCIRKHTQLKDPEISDKHGQYLMGPSVKVYIDPFTYEDPSEAVRQFAKEIDVSFVKIEGGHRSG